MPKFEKGSQEAKDHMASLRAKRGQKSGAGVEPPSVAKNGRMGINRPKPLKGKGMDVSQKDYLWSPTLNRVIDEEVERQIREQAERGRERQNLEQRRARIAQHIRMQVRDAMGRARSMHPAEAVMYMRSLDMNPNNIIPQPVINSLVRFYEEGRGDTRREGAGLGWGDVKRTLKTEGKKVKRVIKKAGDMTKAKDRNRYPAKVKRLLAQNGNRVITSATINRKPVAKQLTGLLNVLSLGQFKKNVDAQPYDDLFHLSIVLHTEDGKTIMVEKNEVINMGMSPKKGGETYHISPFSTGKTLSEIMERTRERMGDERFFSYSAKNNNCQDFILALLQANGMGDADEFAFVKQDTKQIFKGLKTLSSVADFITDIAGGVSAITGKGGKVSRPRQIAPTEQPIILIEDKTPDKSKWRRKVESLEENMETIATTYLLGKDDAPEKEKWRMMYRTLLQEAQAYRKAIIDPPADTDDIVIDMGGLGVGVSKAQIESNRGQADRMRAYKMDQQRQALYAHRKKAIADDIRKMKQSALERRKRMFGKGAGASVPQSQLRDGDISAITSMIMRHPRTPLSTRMWLVDTGGDPNFYNFYRQSPQYQSFQQGMMSAEDSVSDWILSVPLPEHYRMYDDDDDEVENRLDDGDGAGYDSTSTTERLSQEEDTDPRMGGTGAGASTNTPPPPPSNPNTRQVFATNDLLGHISSFAPPLEQVIGVRVNMRDTDMPYGFGSWRSRVFVARQYYDDGTDLAIRPIPGDTRRFYDEEGGEVFPSHFTPTRPWITDERDEPPNQEFFPNAMSGSGFGDEGAGGGENIDSQFAKSEAEIAEIRRQIEARRIRIEELQRKVREDKRKIEMNRKAKSMF